MKSFIQIISASLVLLTLSTHITVADTDHNKAKQLLDAGEILSLEKILAKVSMQYPGHILEVELEIKKHIPVYEIDIIDDKGLVWELKVDAKTAEVIKRKQDD